MLALRIPKMVLPAWCPPAARSIPLGSTVLEPQNTSAAGAGVGSMGANRVVSEFNQLVQSNSLGFQPRSRPLKGPSSSLSPWYQKSSL
jgi:hypothetical protein